jgi:hypothetical protein
MTKPIPRIRISDDLSLPISFVVTTHAILGKKRTGKSYKASQIAEELLRLDKQIVVIDPTSAWWGLRSSSDGLRPGYPITIFGGDHGDLPLEPEAAADIADAIIEDRFSAILDLSDLSRAGEQRFCADFLDRFYRKNPKRPVHVFLDEADVYAPQSAQGDEMKSLGACRNLVLRGGIKGIGITMITQRPARLNKDVLSQIDMLTVIQIKHGPDIDQVKDWASRQETGGAQKEMIASLPNLPKGDAWVWDSADETFVRVTWADKRTFDSGRTPDADTAIEPPKVLAQVDLDRLGATIANAKKAAKDNDPKELRKKIAELQTALQKVASHAIADGPKLDHVVDIARIAAERDDAIARAKEAQAFADVLEDLNDKVTKDLDAALDIHKEIDARREQLADVLLEARNRFGATVEAFVEKHPAPPAPKILNDGKPYRQVDTPVVSKRPRGKDAEDPRICAFLTALQQHGPLAKGKILIHTGFAASGKASDTFALLVREGWASALAGSVLEITKIGSAYLAHTYGWKPLPTGDDLYEYVMKGPRLDERARAFLRILRAAHPSSVSKGDMLEQSGFSPSGKASDAFAHLVALGYAVKAGSGRLTIASELVG